MLVERFEVPGLAHNSYAVGCEEAGEIAIVDPERNVGTYVEYARQRGLRITHVLETHIHADYASGARELAEATGARLCLSAYDEGEQYEIAFAHADLRDGDAIEIGSVRVVARHTPGHTPEHLSFLVSEAGAGEPTLMLSGDFLFVGSVGRPDLLGEEAKIDLARKLYRSVRAVAGDLPETIAIHPAHGAGSMCGAGMADRPSSTLAYERMTNPYFDDRLDEDAFVERILGNVPPFPPYYRRMKELNSRGAANLIPSGLAARPAPRPVAPEEMRALIDDGHLVIDLRGQSAFGPGHVPGALSIGSGAMLATWAAWVVPPETPMLLVANEPGGAAGAAVAAQCLARVGLDDVVGYLDGGMDAWTAAAFPVRETNLVRAEDLHAQIERGDNVRILDVRSDAEWNNGHAEGAIHVMAGFLADRLDEIPAGPGPIAVTCGGGYRSSVAVSVLERAGYDDVSDVIDGMAAWHRARLPIVRDEAAALPHP